MSEGFVVQVTLIAFHVKPLSLVRGGLKVNAATRMDAQRGYISLHCQQYYSIVWHCVAAPQQLNCVSPLSCDTHTQERVKTV